MSSPTPITELNAFFNPQPDKIVWRLIRKKALQSVLRILRERGYVVRKEQTGVYTARTTEGQLMLFARSNSNNYQATVDNEVLPIFNQVRSTHARY